MKKFRKKPKRRRLPKLPNWLSYTPMAAFPFYGITSVVSRAIPYYPSVLLKFFSSGEGLVHYSDIGKQARDLLFTDYKRVLDVNLSFDRYSGNVTVGNSLPGHLSALLKYRSLNAQLKYGLDNVVSMHYLHHQANANFTAILGLFHNPLLDFSGVVGNHIWSLGFDGSMDVNTSNCQSLNLGLSCVFEKFTASFNSYHMVDLLSLSFYQSKLNTAFALELSSQRSTDTDKISIGYEHSFGSDLLVKSTVDSTGMIAGLFQYRWNPRTYYKISAEADTNHGISFGFACSFTS